MKSFLKSFLNSGRSRKLEKEEEGTTSVYVHDLSGFCDVVDDEEEKKNQNKTDEKTADSTEIDSKIQRCEKELEFSSIDFKDEVDVSLLKAATRKKWLNSKTIKPTTGTGRLNNTDTPGGSVEKNVDCSGVLESPNSQDDGVRRRKLRVSYANSNVPEEIISSPSRFFFAEQYIKSNYRKTLEETIKEAILRSLQREKRIPLLKEEVDNNKSRRGDSFPPALISPTRNDRRAFSSGDKFKDERVQPPPNNSLTKSTAEATREESDAMLFTIAFRVFDDLIDVGQENSSLDEENESSISIPCFRFFKNILKKEESSEESDSRPRGKKDKALEMAKESETTPEKEKPAKTASLQMSSENAVEDEEEEDVEEGEEDEEEDDEEEEEEEEGDENEKGEAVNKELSPEKFKTQPITEELQKTVAPHEYQQVVTVFPTEENGQQTLESLSEQSGSIKTTPSYRDQQKQIPSIRYETGKAVTVHSQPPSRDSVTVETTQTFCYQRKTQSISKEAESPPTTTPADGHGTKPKNVRYAATPVVTEVLQEEYRSSSKRGHRPGVSFSEDDSIYVTGKIENWDDVKSGRTNKMIISGEYFQYKSNEENPRRQ
ncbi:myb-like protein V [Centruroides sculpturatus]|uniref:myb-like protein V n=1 Tax=Centruroides sculpturatus TaxID=218467 RepID=UPI000C6D65FB|nr:myb-like protein V [Centruroides sculpturatus]